MWNHEGGIGVEPSDVLSIPVEQGFYSIVLGDSEIEGIATLPDEILNSTLELVFVFGLMMVQWQEQLGKDQPLLVALCIKFASTILVSIFGAISGGSNDVSLYWGTINELVKGYH